MKYEALILLRARIDTEGGFKDATTQAQALVYELFGHVEREASMELVRVSSETFEVFGPLPARRRLCPGCQDFREAHRLPCPQATQ